MFNIHPSARSQFIFFTFLTLYLLAGFGTDYFLLTFKPNSFLEDFGYYERALEDSTAGKDPYAIRLIGPAYLYPPTALLVVEPFHFIHLFSIKVLLYSLFNVAAMIFIIHGIARHYGYSAKEVWYWYVFCLGFAPFHELLYVGQINVITLLGLFVFFFWLESSPLLSGFGLSLAILTKVSPAIFMGYLLVTKKIKVFAAVTLWTIIFMILSILRYGISPLLAYPEVFRWLSNQFPISNNSQSLVSKLATVFRFEHQTSLHQTIQQILILYILLVIVTSIFLTRIHKQPNEPLFIITTIGMMILPNVMWYHHYVFLLLPLLIWMGWKHLDWQTTTWCLAGLIIIQFDRYITYGLLTHIFAHISILLILKGQVQDFLRQRSQEMVPAL